MIKKFLKDKFNINTSVFRGRGGAISVRGWKNNKELYIELDLRRVGFSSTMFIGRSGRVVVAIPFLSISFKWWKNDW